MGGQFWAFWPAFVSFFREECSLRLTKELEAADDAYQLTVKSGCYWWPNHDFVMACARPVEINRNATGQLHADGKLAISWPDGWGLYMLNGVKVPDWLVLNQAREISPSVLTTDKSLESVDVRREFIRKVGIERCLDVLGWQPKDTMGDYTLGEVTVGEGTTRKYLKMLNPSVKVWHLEAVHPECETVQEALNYRAYGDRSKTWQPDILS
jgi:hypothetical protein